MKSKYIYILHLSFFLLLSCHFSFAQQNEIDSLKKVLQAASKEDSSKVNILNALCFQLQNTGDYVNAMGYALKAYYLAEKIGFQKGVGTALNYSGLIYNQQGNYPKALDYFLKAQKIREQIGNKKEIASTLNNLGTVYYAEKIISRRWIIICRH